MKKSEDFIGMDGHLTDEGVAMWTDAQMEKSISELPGYLLDHVEECSYCQQMILNVTELATLMKDDNLLDLDTLSHERIIQRNAILRKSTSQKTGENSPIRKLFPGLTILRAASIAAFLIGSGILMYLLLYNPVRNPENLFAQNFTPYPDIVTSKGETSVADSASYWLDNGLSFYNSGRYEMASLRFKKVLEFNHGNDTALFYLANSILAAGNKMNEAISIMEKLSNQNNRFSESAMWYLSLAYLKIGEPSRALPELSELGRKSDYYRDKARLLSEKIRNSSGK